MFQVIMIQVPGNQKKKQMAKSESRKCTTKPELTVSAVVKTLGE